MSRTIDERVVSMQFDNKQFESNVRTSMGTLDKLKQSLKLESASSGLEKISTAVKKCDFSPMGKAVDTVRIKFSALEVMAVTALSNITNSAVNAGKRIAKALTIDPVKSGLSEYETQINAIQTIMANTQSKGTTLDQVNAALDELNKYADMTIYNFTEMTKNIGTFTAAGVDLDTSVAAIKGIANLAAVSGSTSQQAATAMYQLSQALSSGTVKLMDWNSVVNAGMGGQVFQDALKETARVHKINIDAMIKKEGSFRETLSNGWLSSEILLETLQKFTGDLTSEQLKAMGYTEAQIKEIQKLGQTANDAATKVKTFTQLIDTTKESVQSGWTQTWEYIIGDFEQAKTLWTGVSNVLNEMIGNSADRRNAVLYGALTSKWDKMIDKINEAGLSTDKFEESVKKVAKEHGYPIDQMIKDWGSFENAIRNNCIPTKILKEALDEASTSAADLSVITKDLKKGLKGDEVKEMQQALSDLGFDFSKFGVDGIFGSETEAALKAFQEKYGLEVTGVLDDATLKALKDATKGVSGLLDSVGDLIGGLDELGGRELLIESFKNAWAGLQSVFKAVKVAWNSVFEPRSTEQKAARLYSIIEAIHSFTENMTLSDETAGKLIRIFKGLFSILQVGKTIIGGGISIAFRLLSRILKGFDINLLDVAASAGDALVKFKDWLFENNRLVKGFDKIIDWTVKSAKTIRDWVKAFIDLPEIQEKLDGIRDFFSGGWKKIKEFAGRLKTAWKTLLWNEDGSLNLEGVKTLLSDFKTNVIDYFTNIDFKQVFKNIGSFFTTLWGFFSDKISATNFGGVLDKIKSIFTALWDYLKEKFSNFSFKGIFNGLKNVFSDFKTKIGEWTAPLSEKFSGVIEKFVAFKDKVVEIFKILGEKIKNNKGSLIALGAISSLLLAILGIKKIVDKLTSPFEFISEIGKSISKFVDSQAALNKAKAKKVKSEAIRNLTTSVLILAGALFIISKIPKEDIWRSLGVLAALALVPVLMALLLKAVDKIPGGGKRKVTDVRGMAKMIISLGASVMLMAVAIKMLGNMDQDALNRGISVVGGFLLIVGILMKTSQYMNAKDAAEFGKMIQKISTSLIIIAIAVKILGGMETNALIKGGAAVLIFMGAIVGMLAMTKFITGDTDKFGKMIKDISVGLLLMAVAVKILGGMETEALVKGGAAVLIFMGAMVGMMAMTKFISSSDTAKFGSMMLSISAGLILMAIAVKMFGKMETKTLVKGGLAMLAFVGIVAMLMESTKLMGKYSFNAGKMGLLILGFATAMLIMAGAIAALSMIDEAKLTKALVAIAGIGLIFTGLMAATKLAKNTKVGTLIALAGAIAIVAGAVIALSFIGAADLTRATLSLVAITGAMALLMFACKSLSDMKMGKTIIALTTMVVVVGLLGAIVLVLSKEVGDADKALKVALAMSTLIVALSISAVLVSKAAKSAPQSWKGIGMLLTLVAGIAIIAGALLAVAIWQLPNIAKQLSAFMTELQPFFNGASSIKGDFLDNIKKLGEAMLAFSAAGAIYSIANFATFGGVNRAFGKFIDFIKTLVPEVSELAKTVGKEDINFKNLNAIVDAITGIAEAMAAVPNTTVAAFASKWGGGAVVSIPNIKAFTSFIESAVPAVKDVAVAVSGSDVSFNSERIMTIVDAIKGLAEAADAAPDTTVTTAFGKFKGFIGAGGSATWTDLSGFAEFVGAATDAVMTFMDKLTQTKITDGEVTKVLKYTDGELDIVLPICDAIKVLAEAAGLVPEKTVAAFGGGELFKKFKGFGIAGGGGKVTSSSDLVGFATFISDATAAVQTFMDNLFYDDNGNRVDKFTQKDADMVLTLCESLSYIGQAAEHAAPIVTGTFGGGGAGGSLLSKGAGGAIGWGSITVTPQLTAFKNWIGETLPVLGDFTRTLKGSEQQAAITMNDAETVKTICDAVSALGGAMEFVPSQGEAEASFTAAFGSVTGMGGVAHGEATVTWTAMLTEFKDWITGVCEVLPDFASGIADAKLTDTDISNIDSICGSVTKLAEAAKLAPKHTEYDGVFYDYVEYTDLDSFTGWVASVVPLLTQIASGTYTDTNGNTVSLKNIDSPSIDSLTSIAKAAIIVAKAAAQAPKKAEYDGWFGDYVETTDISETADWFSTVYTTLSGIITDISNNPLDESALTQLTSVATIAEKMADAVFNIGMSLSACEVSDLSFTNAADALFAFVNRLDSNEVDIEAASTAAKAVADIAKSIVSLWNEGMGISFSDEEISELNKSFEDIADSVSTFETSMSGVDVTDEVSQINALVGMLAGFSSVSYAGTSSFVSALEELADTSIDGMLGGFNDGTNKITNAVNEMLNSACSTIKSTTAYSNFASAGKYLVEGFCSGITENTFMAEAKAAAMANAAEEAAREALDINSPSRVFKKIGAGIPEGFVLGIDSMASAVKDSSISMARSAMDNTKNIIAKIVDYLDADVDTQPTIRPVLDLSDVAAGAGSISSMFGNPSIGLSANVASISHMMNHRQNGNNNDVIAAIHDLSKQLGTNTGDTININGITYDDGSNIANAMRDIVRAARVDRRV